MFPPDQYALLDFGDGRRLERFGAMVLDRPCPAAEGVAKADPALWEQADARFVRTEGKVGEWRSERPLPERWTITYGAIVLELKRTEFGHLGVFPEQAANWDWLAERIRRVRETHQSISPTSSPTSAPPDIAPLRVLNLFAYTGASTLMAAACGADVVHVDAARNVVDWARRNAQASGLADAPIRWIAEDAVKFVKRELRRGNQYHAVILDPPSYGHGRRGEVWRLSKHLPRLLQMCAELTAGQRRFLLLTCHTPQFGPARLRRLVAETLGEGRITGEHLMLRSSTGRALPSGVVVRWEAAD
jgi:23S rRNA (cytosine1962-C5)-methyltransferase